MSIDSHSAEDTWHIGESIGAKLRGGEVLELVSDLGGGKTTLTKGLAAGIGSQDVVSSPSFTLTNHYQGSRLHIEHFDFYRLIEPGIMADELKEFLSDPQAVVVIEWGDIIRELLPQRVRLQLVVTGENSRRLEFHYPHQLQYLLEDFISGNTDAQD